MTEHLLQAGLSSRSLSCVTPAIDKQPSSEGEKTCYRILVMGAAKVGKTAIIDQFINKGLSHKYKPTVQEMYQREFLIGDGRVLLEMEDTSGFFAYDFPAMLDVSLSSADVVLLVFSVTDPESFDMAANLRDMVMQGKGPDTPMVIVGNKTDLH